MYHALEEPLRGVVLCGVQAIPFLIEPTHHRATRTNRDNNRGRLHGYSKLVVVPHAERVALASITAVEVATQPADALLARALGEFALVRLPQRTIAHGVR